MSQLRKPGESLVVLEVDPEERRADDGELGEPVRVRRQHDHDRRAVDEALDGRLEERAERLLLAEDPLAVVEGVRDAAVRCASRDLVRHVEAHPDNELEGQMRPAAWQAPGCLGDEARHDVSDSNEVSEGTIPSCGRDRETHRSRSARLIEACEHSDLS